MKPKSLLLLLLAAVLTLAAPRTARAADVSFEFFYDALSPMGEWLEIGDYGYCWRPNDVDEDWAPYSDGYWTYTDAGWTWVSYEDFGGIVYHYGRWVKVEDEGWCWVPDYEWGPAWVSWRRSDDYVGWAPLPAEASWEPERGFSVWVDASYDIGPSYYSFCRIHDFGAPVLRPLILHRSENFVIIGNTVNITNITFNRRAGCVFNGGLDYAYVNRFQHRPIPALKLVRNTNVTVVNNRIVNNNVTINHFNSVQRGNQLTVLAPTVARPQQGQLAALLKPKGARVVAAQKVNRGWSNVPAERREAIREKIAQQTKGLTPETAPAKQVKAEDLKVVPVKADPTAKIPAPTRATARATPAPRQTPITGTPAPGSAEPADAGRTVRGKKPAKGATPAPVAVQQPPGNRENEKIADKKPGKATPIPGPSTAENPPGNPLTEAPGPAARGRTVKPGITKPFNAPATKDGASEAAARRAAAASEAAGKRAAAAEAMKKQTASQEAARERAAELKQQQQEMARRGNAQEAAAAAAARQRTLQQQQDRTPEPPRRRQVEPQVQQQNQQLELQRGRAAQAAEARQKAMAAQQRQQMQQQQQQNQAVARQQSIERTQQAQTAARRAAAAQAPQQRNLPPPSRNAPQAVQRNVQPPPSQQSRPQGNGRRLTPEEEAALKKAR